MNTPEEWVDLSFFHTLFEQASDGYIVLDKDLNVRYLNQTARNWFGDSDTLKDAACNHLVHCERDVSGSLLEERCLGCTVFIERSSRKSEQMNVRNKNGVTFPVSVSYSYVPWQNHESYVMMAMRDISTQKKLEQEKIMNDALHYTVEERERIARDLHDTVAQDLAYAGLQLKQLRREWSDTKVIDFQSISEELAGISQVIDRSIQELRNSLYDLSFELETDLFQYVREHAIQLELRSGIQTEITIEDTGSPWANRVEIQLARMFKEVLTNIHKHSRAHHVQLWIQRTQQDMHIRIQDDGIGFDPTIAQSELRHYGIRSILERCKILGGAARVDTQPGKGTKWEFSVPAHYESVPNMLKTFSQISST